VVGAGWGWEGTGVEAWSGHGGGVLVRACVRACVRAFVCASVCFGYRVHVSVYVGVEVVGVVAHALRGVLGFRGSGFKGLGFGVVWSRRGGSCSCVRACVLCVCVCACVRACVRVCVCVCVCVWVGGG
jgi:hypothetical protein